MRWRLALLPILLLTAVAAGAAEGPAVAVASNLTRPMTEIAARFREETGERVRISFGSSGGFTSQIRQGAPFELFISSDPVHVALLRREGLVKGEPVNLASAPMALFVPRGSAIGEATDLGAVMAALKNGRYRRIAMANPDLAPFGAAAREVLTSAGVWAIEPGRVVLGENVAQAVHFTLAGGVDVGFIPLSFTTDPAIAERGRFFPIPEDWHTPLLQVMTLLSGAGPVAQHFFQFLQQPYTREVLARHRYRVPGGAARDPKIPPAPG